MMSGHLDRLVEALANTAMAVTAVVYGFFMLLPISVRS